MGTGFRITGVILWGLLGLGCLFGPVAPAGAAPPAGKLLVAATIVPLGDFCRQIGGDLVQVQVLIPPGASPHAFEPAPSVMARASQARVFVYIGAGLEPWAARLLRSRGSKNLVVVEAAQGIPLLGLDRAASRPRGRRGPGPHRETSREGGRPRNPPGRQSPYLAGPGAGPGDLPEDRRRP